MLARRAAGLLKQQACACAAASGSTAETLLGLIESDDRGRSCGEASTSYGHREGTVSSQMAWVRCMSGKGKAKGPPSKPGGPPAAGKSGKSAAAVTPVMQTEFPQRQFYLKHLVAKKRPPKVEPLTLLSPDQQELAKSILPPPPAVVGQEEVPDPPDLTSLKQLGMPLDAPDVVSLMHQSLSGALGQPVHFRPYVFTNIFQSAPVVASYVASAMEHGYSWPRVERFFLSSIEEDNTVRGIKVQARGRLGKKPGKAMLKVWQYGEMSLRTLTDHIDYGQAASLTRMGTIGIKVWIRYHDWAIKDVYYRKKTGLSMPLSALLNAERTQLPYRSPSAWWSIPGPLQPLQNRTWDAFKEVPSSYSQGSITTAIGTVQNPVTNPATNLYAITPVAVPQTDWYTSLKNAPNSGTASTVLKPILRSTNVTGGRGASSYPANGVPASGSHLFGGEAHAIRDSIHPVPTYNPAETPMEEYLTAQEEAVETWPNMRRRNDYLREKLGMRAMTGPWLGPRHSRRLGERDVAAEERAKLNVKGGPGAENADDPLGVQSQARGLREEAKRLKAVALKGAEAAKQH